MRSRDQTLHVVRAFSYFSHLANIAEDQHHTRRSRAHLIAGSAPRQAASRTPSGAPSRPGSRRRRWPSSSPAPRSARCSPPTHRGLAQEHPQLPDGDRPPARCARPHRPHPEEEADNEEALRRGVLTLWQTRMLRASKLSVIDEVANGLSFFEATFLSELPRLYGALEDQLAARHGSLAGLELPPFLRVGSWIGGDRDGNPSSPQGCSTRRWRCSARGRWALPRRAAQARLAALARLAPGVAFGGAHGARRALARHLPHRSDEPYRRAISGIYARLSATCRVLLGKAAPRHPVGEAEPYADAAALAADLEIVHRLAREQRLRAARARAAAPAAPRGGGVRLSPGAGRPAPERRRARAGGGGAAGGGPPRVDYLALDEEGASRSCSRRSPRRVRSTRPYVTYSELSTGELAILRMAREAHQRYGTDSVPNCIISKTDGVSDMLELALLLKETGLLDPRAATLAVNLIPLFETIGDLQASGPVMDRLLALPGTGACSIRAP